METKFNSEIYNKKYLNKKLSCARAHDKNYLRIQDLFAALCYSQNIIDYETIERISGLSQNESLLFCLFQTEKFIEKETYDTFQQKENIIALSDSVWVKEESLHHQIDRLKKHTTPVAKKIIEIGAGRGLLTIALATIGCSVIAVEPIEESVEIMEEHLSNLSLPNYLATGRIQSERFFENLSDEDFTDVDNIILCSTIEHLPESYFFSILKRILQNRNKLAEGCKLIITNSWWFFPIDIVLPEHIFRIDQSTYDKIESKITKKLYQKGSHFIGLI